MSIQPIFFYPNQYDSSPYDLVSVNSMLSEKMLKECGRQNLTAEACLYSISLITVESLAQLSKKWQENV